MLDVWLVNNNGVELGVSFEKHNMRRNLGLSIYHTFIAMGPGH